MSAQLSLDLTPPPVPLPPVVDQRVPKERWVTLAGMSVHILQRLRMGPATNVEIAAMFPPATAWRTRISDVRRFLNQQGETVRCEELNGVWTYWIEVVK